MKTSRLITLLFVLTFINIHFRSTAQELSSDESELYNLVMQYRKAKGLPTIPFISKSPVDLCGSKKTHAKDKLN